MQHTECLLDRHIRQALKTTLRKQDSTAAIIDEMPLLRGRGRADLAFVNGKLCGYEIKSEADSLIRLGMQTENYEAVFELNTIVAAKKHLGLARSRIPQTWGIIEAKIINGQIQLHEHRRARPNHKLCNSALTRLLWKEECLLILRKNAISVRPNASVLEIWNRVETMDTKYLCGEVRAALKRRQERVAGRQIQGDGSRTIGAIG
jgi:hypothetical protein